MTAPRAAAHVLVLGGTTEGRRLADALQAIADSDARLVVTSSLAGRVATPLYPAGEVRIGGFGGVPGLVTWLREHRVTAVVDATHPYAATMTSHAAQACSEAGVPLLRLERAAWAPSPGDDWRSAESLAAAAALVDQVGDRAFLTIGRQEVGAFAAVRAWCLMRSIEPPPGPLPARHEILLARGPFALEDELSLLRDRRIDVLVTKNSGGAATAPKLEAARVSGVPVVIVDRPALPPGLECVPDVESAAVWVRAVPG